MTATLHEQLTERLEFIRLTGLTPILAPGRHCTPAVAGLPALSDPEAISVAWSVLDCSGVPLRPGSAFLAPRGLSGGRVDLLFRPAVVEAAGPPPPPLLRTVRATVTLRDTRQRGRAVTVTRVLAATVQVLPLQLPTLLAAFRHREYRFESPEERRTGAALLLVPETSPLATVPDVRAALHALLLAARALSGFARYEAFAGRVRTLVDALAAHPAQHVGLLRADAVPDLARINLLHDAAGDDELSSLVLLGPAGRRVRCCVHRGDDPAGGRLDVTVGEEGIVLLGDLDAPATEPAGRAEAVVAPAGGSFDDALTSLALDRPQPGATLAVDTAELARAAA
jgi:hypothetical protein